MNKLVHLSPHGPKDPAIFPIATAEERTEELARDLVVAVAALRRAELMREPCTEETIARAEQALAAATPVERARLEEVCRPATREDLALHIAAMLGSIPRGSQTVDGPVYGSMMVADVGATEPSKGAVETACRRLRTKSEWLPKIPEVLAAVREAGLLYEAAVRAVDELPALLARARPD